MERLRAIHVDMRGRGEKIAALPSDQGEKTAPEEEAAAEPEQEVKTVKKRGKKMQ